jgi:hypothetical protein
MTINFVIYGCALYKVGLGWGPAGIGHVLEVRNDSRCFFIISAEYHYQQGITWCDAGDTRCDIIGLTLVPVAEIQEFIPQVHYIGYKAKKAEEGEDFDECILIIPNQTECTYRCSAFPDGRSLYQTVLLTNCR